MLSMTEQARESRCRRQAARYDWVLRKSRRYLDQGRYALIHARLNYVVYGTDNSGYCVADLEDIEDYLREPDD